MRFRVPSSILDADVELPLPPSQPYDGHGNITSTDGTASMNYLHVRVQLAYIQGRIYDLLYSSRSRIATANLVEKLKRTTRLHSMLNYWYRSLPSEFGYDMLLTSLSGPPLQHALTLFHSYLLSLFVLSDVHQNFLRIIASIRNWVSAGLTPGMNPELHMSGTSSPTPWIRDCVDHSRACIRVTSAVGQTEYFTW
jgi:hypothetical protein